MKLRIGVIGLGEAWETRHRPALRALRDRFEVRAICADVVHLADQAAREFNAESMSGFRALAARPDIDALFILSPSWFGPLPILAACDHGRSVYCASALDIEPQRGEEIRRRVDDAGIAFMAEFPRRFAPATTRLKELIATKLGQPKMLFCHARAREAHSDHARNNGWHCPVILREMVELVDWCCYVVGRNPGTVNGVAYGPNRTTPDTVYQMLSLNFPPTSAAETPVLAQISCGKYLPSHWPEAISFRPPAQLQVCCERGVAFVDLPTTTIWFDEAGRHMESLESERPVGELLLTQFHRSVTSLVRKTCDLEDAYRALRIVTAGRESCSVGRRIEL